MFFLKYTCQAIWTQKDAHPNDTSGEMKACVSNLTTWRSRSRGKEKSPYQGQKLSIKF